MSLAFTVHTAGVPQTLPSPSAEEQGGGLPGDPPEGGGRSILGSHPVGQHLNGGGRRAGWAGGAPQGEGAVCGAALAARAQPFAQMVGLSKCLCAAGSGWLGLLQGQLLGGVLALARPGGGAREGLGGMFRRQVLWLFSGHWQVPLGPLSFLPTPPPPLSSAPHPCLWHLPRVGRRAVLLA